MTKDKELLLRQMKTVIDLAGKKMANDKFPLISMSITATILDQETAKEIGIVLRIYAQVLTTKLNLKSYQIPITEERLKKCKGSFLKILEMISVKLKVIEIEMGKYLTKENINYGAKRDRDKVSPKEREEAAHTPVSNQAPPMQL